MMTPQKLWKHGIAIVTTLLCVATSVGSGAQTPPPDDDDDFVVNMIAALIPQCQAPVLVGGIPGQPLVAGQMVTLSITCTLNPASYVWRVNGNIIAGATGATITSQVPSGTSSVVFSAVANGRIASPAASSAALTVLAAPNQTISFAALSAQKLNVMTVNISATASSGLPVSFSSATPSFCTVSGSTVTLLAGGTCTITASQAGNTTYTAAAPVNQSFAITTGTELFYVHADHLNTPRAITRADTNALVWKWDNDDPFGNNPAVSNVAGTNFPYPLRFPGQYYDEETGTHYNYFRDYDPATGRYIQSDPIGLKAGVNTFAYSLSKPLLLTDPKGLATNAIGEWGEVYMDMANECIKDPGSCEEKRERSFGQCTIQCLLIGKAQTEPVKMAAEQTFERILRNAGEEILKKCQFFIKRSFQLFEGYEVYHCVETCNRCPQGGCPDPSVERAREMEKRRKLEFLRRNSG